MGFLVQGILRGTFSRLLSLPPETEDEEEMAREKEQEEAFNREMFTKCVNRALQQAVRSGSDNSPENLKASFLNFLDCELDHELDHELGFLIQSYININV